MTDIDTLLAAYDDQLRRVEHTNVPDGVYAEPDGPVVRVVGHHQGFVSAPANLPLGGGELDELIARQRDFFAARGEAVEWKTRGHDKPADLTEHLLAAGFVAEEQETVMIGLAADIARMDPKPPDGVVVREVTDDADMRRIADMASAVWGGDRSWYADELIRLVANGAGQTVVLVAEAGDLVVSAARLVIEPGTAFAGLWGGSTLPEWRGRGIYRTLVAYRARVAVARGVRYLQVDASDDSRPILERLGFTAVTTTTPYVWSPS